MITNEKIKELYITPDLKSDNLILRSGVLDDFRMLNNVWNSQIEYIKNSEEKIVGSYNYPANL